MTIYIKLLAWLQNKTCLVYTTRNVGESGAYILIEAITRNVGESGVYIGTHSPTHFPSYTQKTQMQRKYRNA